MNILSNAYTRKKAQCPTSAKGKRKEEILQILHIMNMVVQIEVLQQVLQMQGLGISGK